MGGGAGLRAAVTGSDSVPWGKLLLPGAALGAGSHVQSPRPSEDLAGADVPSAHECDDKGLVTSVRCPSVLGGGGEVSHQRFRAEAAGLLEGLGERLPPQPACGHHARSAWAAQACGHHARSAWAAQACGHHARSAWAAQACGHHARSAWAAQACGHHARSAWAAQALWGNRPTEGPPRPRWHPLRTQTGDRMLPAAEERAADSGGKKGSRGAVSRCPCVPTAGCLTSHGVSVPPIPPWVPLVEKTEVDVTVWEAQGQGCRLGTLPTRRRAGTAAPRSVARPGLWTGHPKAEGEAGGLRAWDVMLESPSCSGWAQTGLCLVGPWTPHLCRKGGPASKSGGRSMGRKHRSGAGEGGRRSGLCPGLG